MIRDLFSSTVDVLHKNLELRHQRHAVLASNIANAETPGFVAKDLRFEEALRAAAAPPAPPSAPLWRTHPEHLPVTAPQTSIGSVQGALVATPSNDIGRDLNTVSIDQEMAKLTVNTSRYNSSVEMMSRMFDQLKRTISESGQ
jgi:flagellar basal-body rod protein FlgB